MPSDRFTTLGEAADKVVARIRPIPTTHNGVTYRSRLEARWAVFFNRAGIAARYEAEGYDLDGVWYLPDFWLSDARIFVEVKPVEPTEQEASKAYTLARLSKNPVALVIGLPGDHRGIIWPYPEEESNALSFCRCRRCNGLAIIYETSGHPLWDCLDPLGHCSLYKTPMGCGVEEAEDAAAKYQFGR